MEGGPRICRLYDSTDSRGGEEECWTRMKILTMCARNTDIVGDSGALPCDRTWQIKQSTDLSGNDGLSGSDGVCVPEESPADNCTAVRAAS